ncbi:MULTISPECIES: phospho-N-acetylmuramoyl-pentapeptide-transferase [unclassified Candidatus Paralachnospira]|uniref:phospho-N-acetylmuramoyl-pentapeptide- transferase n=1 Tax=unclassified Candidatus Paralachnospira TaxID=3099471 RepID=UPI003F91C60F
MKYAAIIAVLVSFAISAVLCPILIPFLKRLKFGQTIREEGPKAHAKKNGTPTMGGLAILISIAVTSLFFVKDYPKIIPVLFTTVGFGLVGLLDDFIKVVLKRSEGLKPLQKLGCQLIIAGILCYYLMTSDAVSTAMIIPFTGGKALELGWFFIPAFFVIVLGTDNGVNLTDGLDGLCTSVTILVAVFFTVISMGEGHAIEPITGAVVGSLLGFLLFNAYPAKVFMGDTGSLALGGFVVSSAFMLQLPIFILLFGFIYFAETVSVMLQVTYFKATHGKRLFRMTPIHHHFELGGWSETRIVTVFSAVTAILCLIAYMAM